MARWAPRATRRRAAATTPRCDSTLIGVKLVSSPSAHSCADEAPDPRAARGGRPPRAGRRAALPPPRRGCRSVPRSRSLRLRNASRNASRLPWRSRSCSSAGWPAEPAASSRRRAASSINAWVGSAISRAAPIVSGRNSNAPAAQPNRRHAASLPLLSQLVDRVHDLAAFEQQRSAAAVRGQRERPSGSG